MNIDVFFRWIDQYISADAYFLKHPDKKLWIHPSGKLFANSRRITQDAQAEYNSNPRLGRVAAQSKEGK